MHTAVRRAAAVAALAAAYPVLAAGRYHRLYHPNGDPVFEDDFEPAAPRN